MSANAVLPLTSCKEYRRTVTQPQAANRRSDLVAGFAVASFADHVVSTGRHNARVKVCHNRKKARRRAHLLLALAALLARLPGVHVGRDVPVVRLVQLLLERRVALQQSYTVV